MSEPNDDELRREEYAEIDRMMEEHYWFEENVVNPELKDFIFHIFTGALDLEHKIEVIIRVHFCKFEALTLLEHSIISRLSFDVKIQIFKEILNEFGILEKVSNLVGEIEEIKRIWNSFTHIQHDWSNTGMTPEEVTITLRKYDHGREKTIRLNMQKWTEFIKNIAHCSIGLFQTSTEMWKIREKKNR